MTRWPVVAAAMLSLFQATSCSTMPAPDGRAREPFRVALFPWIPDEASPGLVQRIESEFEILHPNVDLELEIDRVGSLAYEVPDADPKEPVVGWWSKPPTSGGFHLAEVDALLLTELAERGAIRAWTSQPSRGDWHPAAVPATEVSGKTFGVPHWMCGYFVFTRDKQVHEARTASDLERALSKLSGQSIAGDLSGSYTVTTVYLDGVADTLGSNSVSQALQQAATCPASPPPTGIPACLEAPVVKDLRRIVRSCRVTDGQNPCLDSGDFSLSPDLAAKRFALGENAALVGYSERLNVIRTLRPASDESTPVLISSAPFGNGSEPLLFIDVFVLSHACDSTCEKTATAFVEYMNDPATHAWIQFHEDRLGMPPRYLLSATKSAWVRLRQDPDYATLDTLLNNATAFPNGGIVDYRRAIRKNVEKVWE